MDHPFWKILSKIKANLVWAIPVVMLLGLAFGSLVNPAFLKSLIFPLTFIMVYPMMINLQLRKALSGEDYKLQLFTLFLNFGVIPFLAGFSMSAPRLNSISTTRSCPCREAPNKAVEPSSAWR